MAEAMKINHLPSLTWNKLKMNAGEIGETVSCNIDVETRFESLPEGISHRAMTFDEGQLWLAAHAPAQTPERFVAGKKPVYHEQRFGTGAGASFDELLEREQTPVHLLTVARGTKAARPVEWRIAYQDGNRAATAQLLYLQENAEATVVMSYVSDRQAQGFSGVSTKIVLEKGAKLHLVKAQLLGDGFLHIDDLGATLAEDAALTLVQMELGAARTFAGAEAHLFGNKSAFTVRAGYLGVGEQQLDLNYNAVQRGRRTQCQMDFDGVLRDRAQKILRGTIDFRNGSAGSKGNEAERALLLSPDVVNRSIPVILCEEEDIEGGHGATIGRLDDEMLFYLETRGIGRREAEELMVRASLGAVAREIPNETLQKEVMAYIEERFSAY